MTGFMFYSSFVLVAEAMEGADRDENFRFVLPIEMGVSIEKLTRGQRRRSIPRQRAEQGPGRPVGGRDGGVEMGDAGADRPGQDLSDHFFPEAHASGLAADGNLPDEQDLGAPRQEIAGHEAQQSPVADRDATSRRKMRTLEQVAVQRIRIERRTGRNEFTDCAAIGGNRRAQFQARVRK
jgi:hypothetical protein